MSKYGTQMTESELILAANERDIVYMKNLLAGMSGTELAALARAVHLLTDQATEEVTLRNVGHRTRLVGYRKECGTEAK